ncbi:MAG: aldehyde dehydrogenase family protein [Microbacteriaceae bacterium]
MESVPLFVDGQCRAGVAWSEIRDPALPDVSVGRMASATGDDVDDAIAGATRAYAGWSAMPARQRAEQLETALATIMNDTEFVAECERLLTRETGKIIGESHIDIVVFAIRWRLALDLAEQVEFVEPLPEIPGSGVVTTIRHAALGPVTIIVPYNWPLTILAASLPAALLAGNPVMVKPPASAPLATARFITRIAERLPAGVLSVIAGSDLDVEPLVTDSRIAKVCFTGSVATGVKLMALSAPRLGRLTLELGGNDAAIVCEDAVLDEVHLDRMFHAIFDTSGQICMNIKRLYVHASRLDECVSGLEARLHTVVLGHGIDEATTHGPVHSAQLAERIESLIAEAAETGAEVRRFGTVPQPDAGAAAGYYVRPALVIHPPATARVVTEEQFGPVIPILPFDTEGEAIAVANDSWAGLGGSVWSADEVRAQSLAQSLVAGYVWVNDHGAPRLDLRAPFGGWRQSGFGREQGLAGIREFMDTRTIAVTKTEHS